MNLLIFLISIYVIYTTLYLIYVNIKTLYFSHLNFPVVTEYFIYFKFTAHIHIRKNK